MIRSHFNKQLGILEVRYYGRLSYKELKKFSEQLCKDQSIPRRLKMLTDGRESEYAFKEKELPLFFNTITEQLKDFSFVKAAFIQNRPRETAISLLAGRKNKNPNYLQRVFSTPEAALDWLLGKSI